jgi:outer membrane lipoprotein-sorting protein
MRFTFFSSVVLLLSASVAAIAGQGQTEFSADVIQSIPQQKPQHGKLYVGNDKMRTEMTVNGKTMVQIVDMKTQTAYMLDPEEHSYIVRKAGPGDMTGGREAAKGANPCAGMQNLICTRLGIENVNGRMAEKWEMSSKAPGQSGKMTIWLDKERHMPLRQEFPDGSSMEMRLVGKEELNGRTTEKWELTMTRPGGQSNIIYQWYDPELKVNIREERPGGFVSELRNIKIGKQPADLFTVPADYKEVNVPRGGAQEPGADTDR